MRTIDWGEERDCVVMVDYLVTETGVHEPPLDRRAAGDERVTV
ncbi:MAG: hypothetical protein ABEH61_03770 [Haloarculaceae archaeon]